MDYPIRVLCVFSTLDLGGAESMCMNLYRWIDRNKIQFDFVKHTIDKGVYEDEIHYLGGKIFTAPAYRLSNHIAYCNWWNDHFIRHPEHIIIHGHYFTISAVYFHVARMNKRITVGHIHATQISSITKKLFVKLIKYEADYRLACSIKAGKWIYGNRPFIVLKNALNSNIYKFNKNTRDEYRELLNIRDCLVIGTVANFSKVKNPLGLIDIFIEIKKESPSAKLLWVGEGGMRSLIERRIQQERIESDVILMGARNDVPNILQAMDVFLLPSYNEGLPLSAIEAQASGLPCYLSDAITTEVDITGRCFFLPIDKPEQWAEAIDKHKIQRNDTSSEIIKAGYDIRTTVSWLQEFYFRIMIEIDNHSL